MSREGHGRDRLSLNYRSFMFGKLPPPACPGLCYHRLPFFEQIFFENEDVRTNTILNPWTKIYKHIFYQG